jgi:hypothetical protein
MPDGLVRSRGPRSSGDRAPPSGGGSAGSNPAGGAHLATSRNGALTRACVVWSRPSVTGCDRPNTAGGGKYARRTGASWQGPAQDRLALSLGSRPASPLSTSLPPQAASADATPRPEHRAAVHLQPLAGHTGGIRAGTGSAHADTGLHPLEANAERSLLRRDREVGRGVRAGPRPNLRGLRRPPAGLDRRAPRSTPRSSTGRESR